MTKTADELRKEALDLPPRDRVRLASELLASLDSEVVDEDKSDRLWSIETQRRTAMLEFGEAGTIPSHGLQSCFSGVRST